MIQFHPDTTFINESGVYQLVMNSKLESAELFQDWVYEDLLPTIRKTGEYKLQQQLNEKDKQFQEQQKMIELKNNQLHNQQNEINLLKNKNIKLKREQFEGKHIEYENNTKQKIYIVTTKQGALKFNHKVGGTKNDTSKRIVSLNTSFPKNDQLELVKEYEVYNFKIIEHLVHKVLDKFRSGEHIIGVPWHYLQPLIEQAIECEKLMIEKYNESIDNILKDIDNDKFIEELPFTVPINRKKCKPLKIDNKGNIENNLSNDELVAYKQEIQKLSTKKNSIPWSKLNKPKYIIKPNNIDNEEEFNRILFEQFKSIGYLISNKKGKKN